MQTSPVPTFSKSIPQAPDNHSFSSFTKLCAAMRSTPRHAVTTSTTRQPAPHQSTNPLPPEGILKRKGHKGLLLVTKKAPLLLFLFTSLIFALHQLTIRAIGTTERDGAVARAGVHAHSGHTRGGGRRIVWIRHAIVAWALARR
jgi:hypothetical protein